jgi:amino acid transporter
MEKGMETPQHRRPLWMGLLACALTPTALLVVELMGSSDRVMIPVMAVLIVSLPASLLATCLVALPYTLWLRRRERLSSLRLCVAGVMAGAAVLAAFNFYMSWYPQMRDHSLALSIALQSARRGATGGALLGLLASMALVVGAGVPFRRAGRAKSGAV